MPKTLVYKNQNNFVVLSAKNQTFVTFQASGKNENSTNVSWHIKGHRAIDKRKPEISLS